MVISDGLKQYMRGISEFPLLKPDEEVKLATAIHHGEKWALDHLVRSNLRLVVTIALELGNRGANMEELVAEGNIGLIHAARKFDPEKGAKFSSYAAWWIKQSMRRAISESSKVIRIPTSSLRKIRRIAQINRELEAKLGREPTDQEISDSSEFSLNVVNRLRRAEPQTVSLQAPITQGEADTISDLIPDEQSPLPDHQLIAHDISRSLCEALPHLSEREQYILYCRFGLDGKGVRTLEEISQALGLTRERIRQIQKRALQRMRQLMAEAEAPQRPFAQSMAN